jgi:hypothetical protein
MAIGFGLARSVDVLGAERIGVVSCEEDLAGSTPSFAFWLTRWKRQVQGGRVGVSLSELSEW